MTLRDVTDGYGPAFTYGDGERCGSCFHTWDRHGPGNLTCVGVTGEGPCLCSLDPPTAGRASYGVRTTAGYRGAPARPRVGDVVLYRSRTDRYTLPAVVTAVQESIDPAGVAAGDVAALHSGMHVHLHVMSPGPSCCYTETNVPYDAAGAAATWSFRTE